MTRRIWSAAVMTLTGLGVIGLGLASAESAESRAKTIKEVMGALNKGPKSESAKLKTALAAKTPDWTAIQASTKEYADLGPELAENDPPKGAKDHWKTQADRFAAQSKALNDAADKKDLVATKAAFQKISTSCMPCHNSHKGR